ncbi:MAG: FAD-dependent oxidoreductase [Acidimicrobiia bacterium]|nr:FAD-dependent oxidoreductase [Acidimicrobiia bacterium]MYC57971.1 FAD-dependent oxidoreductase [Acidimicrobiia bacterium]MYI31080.1 FAD-dependent oxidoreductase [Acidimicrobiia bacterium]
MISVAVGEETPPTPEAAPHIAVVGAGLAGLAAAIAVVDAGMQVTLYERAPRLGGATWSFQRNGRWFDNGQHVFMRCCSEYKTFLERLGVSHQVVQQPRLKVPVMRPGRPTAHIARISAPAPLHMAGSLLCYRPLSVGERMRAIRTALALRRLNLEDHSLDQQSFGSWLSARGESEGAIAGLWDLICLPTVNLRAHEASLALAAKVFRTGLLDAPDGADLGWTKVPLAVLHGEAAAAHITGCGGNVQMSAQVAAIGEGPCLTVGGEEVAVDAVILAVSHEVVDELLPSNTLPQQKALTNLGISPIFNVHFVFDRTVMDVPFTAVLDSPVQFVFDRSEAAAWKRPYNSEQVVAVSQSAAFGEIGDSPSELIERYYLGLVDLFPKVAEAEVLDAVVTREHGATFAGRPNTARLRPESATAMNGLFLAGAWTATGWPATMEGAVRSGNVAAQLAVQYCRRGEAHQSPKVESLRRERARA